jgi:DUF2075 family protein
MIIYRNTKAAFLVDLDSGQIDKIILKAYHDKTGRLTSSREIDSWFNSLEFMGRVVDDDSIPHNAGVAIECQIPQTAKRIDFLISGTDENQRPNVVIVELKQWQTAQLTEKDGIVKTYLGRGLNETEHPSYKAWTYAALLQDFSETVQQESIQLAPCAFLHNYEEDTVIRNPFFKEYLEKAPVFLKRDRLLLRDFIKRHVKVGDKSQILYRIEQGKIRPSKQLSEALASMLKGNQEFYLIDEQKLVYETALSLVKQAQTGGKKVLIVEGGPGTGKSVVAINLLVEITKRELLCQYISKNAAPRQVFQTKLSKTLNRTRFAALFQGSGRFTDSPANEFDALVVDEAHRLNEKSGMYQNLGENQIKEIIHSARCSIFFLDEDQRVTMSDIGTKDEIKQWADYHGAKTEVLELPSQFRCNGSDGYLAFLDHSLQIRETTNTSLQGIDYDFRVVDSPVELDQLIREKNKLDNKSRLVAGYCWDWNSKNDPKAMDIVFPDFNYARQWNLSVDGSLWIIKENSIDQIGCIHTCQGLELNYVGVIIGPDLIVRDGQVLVDPSKRSKMDRSIRGYKSQMKTDPEGTKRLVKMIIKNTYRTLMTRGMKGCYIYSPDAETRAYFKNRLKA